MYIKNYLHLILFTVIVICAIQINNVKGQKCPSICHCFKLADGLKQISCSNKNLVNVLEVNIKVQLLDYSHNEITILKNDDFYNLKDLITLDLYKNAISTIEFDVFSSLKNLQNLDISDNRLENLDNRILENNKKLKSVNFSRNKFMSLNNKPFLISKSLQILDLRESQIVHIYSKLFEELPNLSTLDLSNNLLIILNINDIRNLRNLTSIKLENNKWICDINLANAIQWLERNNVRVIMKECKIPNKPSKMFERMELGVIDEKNETLDLDWTEQDDSINSTISFEVILEHECDLLDPERACDLFTQCQEYYSILSKQLQHLLDQERKEYNTCSIFNYPKSITKIIFFVGLILGSIFGGVIIYGIHCLLTLKCVKKKSVQRQLRRVITERSRYVRQQSNISRQMEPDQHFEVSNEGNITFPEIFPLNRIDTNPQRRPCRRHNSRQPRQESETMSFFASLFKRRRTYPRRLIRRLSRSNLFNSTFRLSTIQTNARNAAESSGNVEAHRLLNNSTPDVGSNSTESMNIPNINGDYTVLSTRPIPDENRSETPPPSYECIIINVNK